MSCIDLGQLPIQCLNTQQVPGNIKKCPHFKGHKFTLKYIRKS